MGERERERERSLDTYTVYVWGKERVRGIDRQWKERRESEKQ